MKIIDNDLTIQEVCGRIGGYHRCSLEDGYPFLYVSLKFQEIFGWSKEEIETRFDNKLMNMVHPEDRSLDRSISFCFSFVRKRWISLCK